MTNFKEEMRNNMLVVLETLQFFQVILIGFSGLLAFAVMMVLGRMNYYERTRGLAPLFAVFSIATGFAFILGFTLLANYAMGRKFKGVDMVVSLKSVE